MLLCNLKSAMRFTPDVKRVLLSKTELTLNVGSGDSGEEETPGFLFVFPRHTDHLSVYVGVGSCSWTRQCFVRRCVHAVWSGFLCRLIHTLSSETTSQQLGVVFV